MVEATPNRPYNGCTNDLLRVERNMCTTKAHAHRVGTEVAPTISAFFMLGAQGNDGSVPLSKFGGPRASSEYLSDDVIHPHSAFWVHCQKHTLSTWIKNVNIRIPLFRDLHTMEFKDFDLLHGDVDGVVLVPKRYGR